MPESVRYRCSFADFVFFERIGRTQANKVEFLLEVD